MVNKLYRLRLFNSESSVINRSFHAQTERHRGNKGNNGPAPQIKIIVLTVHKSEEYIIAALDAGAKGYILKDASRNELILALDYVMAGKTFLSPSISDKVVSAYLEQKKNTHASSLLDSLTSREQEILKLIAEGHKNKDIADHLCISLKTVEKHRSNLMQKLDRRNTAALTAYAIEKGIISL